MTGNEVPAGAWLALALYFLPMIVAVTKKHHNVTAIAVLNLLSGVPALAWLFLAVASPLGSVLNMQALGVAFLMWSGALVWACTATAVREAATEADEQPLPRRRVGRLPQGE